MTFLLFILNPFFVMNMALPGEYGILSSTPFSSVVQQIRSSERKGCPVRCTRWLVVDGWSTCVLTAPRSRLWGHALRPHPASGLTGPSLASRRGVHFLAAPSLACWNHNQGFLDSGSLAAALRYPGMRTGYPEKRRPQQAARPLETGWGRGGQLRTRAAKCGRGQRLPNGRTFPIYLISRIIIRCSGGEGQGGEQNVSGAGSDSRLALLHGRFLQRGAR